MIGGEPMSDPETHRVPRKATAEERRQVREYRAQIERDLPELRREAIQADSKLRAAAMREPTVTGQLRRAIHESGMDHRELAAQAGISAKTLVEFLVGVAVLDSSAVDKLAALLKQELKPIG